MRQGYFHITIFLLVFWLPTKAQLVGGEAFLKGNYIEVGISTCGSYGTSGDVPASGGYHSRNGFNNGMGFVADIGKDGFNVGNPNFCGDYFLPGAPVEGWGIEINGQNYINTNTSIITGGICSSFDIPGTIISYDTIDTFTLCAIWMGRVNGMDITQRTCFHMDSLYFTTEVRFCNDTTIKLRNIYYARNLDPDNDQTLSSNFSTVNTIVSQPSLSSPDALVTATGTVNAGCYLGLGARDGRAKVTYGGFNMSLNISDYFLGNPPYMQSGTNTADEAISIGFNIGDLDTNQCVCFSFAYILDPNQLDNALNATASVLLFADSVNITGNPRAAVCTGSDSLLLTLKSLVDENIDWHWSPATGLSDTVGDSIKAYPSTTTTYTITGNGNFGLCDALTRQVTIYFDTIPLKVIDTVACRNSPFQLNLSNLIEGASYLWLPGTGLDDSTISNPTITLDSTITYTLIGTTTNGCIDSNIIIIEADSTINIDAGDDIIVCEMRELIIGGSPTADSLVEVLWTPINDQNRLLNRSTHNPTFNATVDTFWFLGIPFFIPIPDTIFYEVQEQKCFGSDTMMIAVLQQDPEINGLRDNYCPISDIDTAHLSPFGGTLSGMGLMDSIFDPASIPVGGPYYIEYAITDTASFDSVCITIDTFIINIIALDTPEILGLDSAYCANAPIDNLTLNPAGGSLSGPGINGNSFNPQTANIGLDTISYIYINNLSGCTSFDTVQTIVIDIPTGNIVVDSFTCSDSANIVFIGDTGAIVTYNWNFDFGSSTISGSEEGPYWIKWTPRGIRNIQLNASDTNNCSISISKPINVVALIGNTISGLDSTYCANGLGDSLILDPTGGIIIGAGIDSIFFNPSLANIGENVIVYHYTDSSTNCSSSDTLNTFVFNTPSGNIILDSFTCTDESIISFTGDTNSIIQYNWNFDTTSSIISGSNQGAYIIQWGLRGEKKIQLLITDSNNCSILISDTIDVVNLIANATTIDSSIIISENTTLHVSAMPEEDIYTYQWEPSQSLDCTNCSTTIANPTDSTMYIVKVTHDQHGCIVYDTLLIAVDNRVIFEIPSAFTPNGDNENDEFLIIGQGLIDDIQFKVLNRWGDIVFETNSLEKGWDGTFQGKQQPIGSYNYIISVTDYLGMAYEKAGQFTLIR